MKQSEFLKEGIFFFISNPKHFLFLENLRLVGNVFLIPKGSKVIPLYFLFSKCYGYWLIN